MSMSYLPRWKFTDSCGQPRAHKTTHVGGCSSDHVPGYHRTRREFFKTGIAIAGAAGFGMILDPREVLAQGRVFPPPPPAVSPIAGLMDTHVHTAPDVRPAIFDRSVMMSSLMPSEKYSCSGSPDMLVNGKTAIDAVATFDSGLAAMARRGVAGVVPACHLQIWIGRLIFFTLFSPPS